MAGHDHPLFTRVYGVVAALGERTGLGDMRARVLASARGRLLIVGLGPGHDLEHLPDAVTSVVAIEPSASMRAAAAPRIDAARARGLQVEVLDAMAEDLPLADDSVDSVLLTYVLCTIDEVPRALAEVCRVLTPDGVVGVFEHVRAPEGTWLRTSQRLVARVWPRLAGGCRADRDTRAALAAAGFDVSGLREFTLVNLPPVAPTLAGECRIPPGV